MEVKIQIFTLYTLYNLHTFLPMIPQMWVLNSFDKDIQPRQDILQFNNKLFHLDGAAVAQRVEQVD